MECRPSTSISTSTFSSAYPQDEVLRQSTQDPAQFWSRQAEHLHWHRKPNSALKVSSRTVQDHTVSHPTWTWFPGGEISTCYNCVDRHVLAGNGHQPALFYDSPVSNARQTITYSALMAMVETLAGVLREKGIRKGDVVMLYMPMIPAAVVGMLAANRLGAIHSVVFGGFAPTALAQRIDSCKPDVFLTASCGIVGNRPPIAYQPLVEEAMRLSSHKPLHTIVWQREQLLWQFDQQDGDPEEGGQKKEGKKETRWHWWTRMWMRLRAFFFRRWGTKFPTQSSWQNLIDDAKARGVRADCQSVRSEQPIYVMHTSGTTGSPKGVVRSSGGHAVGLQFTIRYIFNIHGPGDVIFTASDVGWVVGHSYIVYAPLLAGAATVLYEGKPVGTPNASAFWSVVERYRVNIMFATPTALRAIRQEDPQDGKLAEVGERGGLRTLKALFLAGERSEPSLVSKYQALLERYGAGDPHVIDNWWSTEAGSPITGRALAPHVVLGTGQPATKSALATIPSMKPGSAGKPLPGFDVRVVDENGEEVARGKMGYVVLTLPLGPTAFTSLWKDEARFYHSYMKRFNGKFMDTGDAGWMDEEGYVHVMSRNDDVLNVSAYRLSSGAIEEAISSHPSVAEACVVGIPDELKGQLPFAFITLSLANHPASAIPDTMLAQEIQKLVRGRVGAFASLAAIVQGKGMIPKTRSGKTLRRVLRELVENGVHEQFERPVEVPSTIEDMNAVEVARKRVREYFELNGGRHKALEDEEKACVKGTGNGSYR